METSNHAFLRVSLGESEQARSNPLLAVSSKSSLGGRWQQILALTLLHIHTLPGGPLPLLCSHAHAGVVLPPPSHTSTLRHTLSPTGLRWASTLSLSPSLSLARVRNPRVESVFT